MDEMARKHQEDMRTMTEKFESWRRDIEEQQAKERHKIEEAKNEDIMEIDDEEQTKQPAAGALGSEIADSRGKTAVTPDQTRTKGGGRRASALRGH